MYRKILDLDSAKTPPITTKAKSRYKSSTMINKGFGNHLKVAVTKPHLNKAKDF